MCLCGWVFVGKVCAKVCVCVRVSVGVCVCEIARGREPLCDVTNNFLSVFPFLLSLCKSQKGPLFIILCILFLSHSFISHLSPPSFLSIFFISSVFHRSVPNRFGCFLYFFFLFLSISFYFYFSFSFFSEALVFQKRRVGSHFERSAR